MIKNIFVTFDFGMKGDYDGLFKWLDENNAEERGYGVARIPSYNLDKNITTDLAVLKSVRETLKERINIGNSDRIYLMWPSLEKKSLAAGFAFGKQKQAPWEGFAHNTEDKLDIEFE